ncbi:MAG: universal stress protein [Flavobacteriales bacterium]|jgi:nucleotide-binding universal stress UspA family protein|nr:universal stress protein [Crocinitomicaceae bacterium]NBX79039.1 universal stress protein [Flavobacteriales bacterium]
MKNILIAVDFNPSAEKVAEEGYKLAKSMNANLTLVHVVSDLAYYSSIRYEPIMGFEGFLNEDYLFENPIENLKEESKRYLESIKKHLNDHSILTFTLEGDAADAIIDFTEKEKIDYVVMGSHSRRILEDLFMGSVTQKVLHHSNVPLLVISTK